MRKRTFLTVALLGAGVLVAAGIALAGGERSRTSAATAGTARFHDLSKAEAAGYAEFHDAQDIACIEHPGVGGMGIHFVNGTLVGDPALDPRRPEALVYEPRRNGKLKLVALEYIVFQEAWDAAHAERPALFGQRFNLVDEPNRYGLPAFYELHTWIWKPNPAGLFQDWNPRIDC